MGRNTGKSTLVEGNGEPHKATGVVAGVTRIGPHGFSFVTVVHILVA